MWALRIAWDFLQGFSTRQPERILEMKQTHLSSSLEPYPTGTSNPPLPIELIIQALGHLEKHELKIVRLVCKIWSDCASERLFDKLHISPRKEDVRVFKLITQHPQLSQHVKKLEYDATRFSLDLSIRHYIRNLLQRTPVENYDFGDMHGIRLNENLDPQIEEALDLLQSCRNDTGRPWLWEYFVKFDFIIEGHRRWQECAAYQERCIRSGDYHQLLTDGLRNLDRVESVHVCQKWDINPSRPLKFHQAHYYDSPFGRTWNIFCAPPSCWEHDGSLADACDDFWGLTRALALSQRRIREFKTTLPPVVFDTKKYATKDMVEYSVNAYSGLESLSLKLWHEKSRIKPDSKLDGLQSLFRSMIGLTKLDLCPSHDGWEAFLSLDQVVPAGIYWEKLTSFRLCAVSTSAKDLVQLLTIGMPQLQVLRCLQVLLVEGRWEGVIECIKRSLNLRHLCLDFDRRFWEYKIRDKDVEQYVLRGGRHPCLLSDEPDLASEKYLSAPWL